MQNFIWKFVSKDNAKPELKGVYMDPEEKVAVATNANVMLVSHELYDESKAGMIVYKDGTSIRSGSRVKQSSGLYVTVRFPRWRSAIPQDFYYRGEPRKKNSDGFYKEVLADAWLKDRIKAATRLNNTKGFSNVAVYFAAHTWVDPHYAEMMMSWSKDGWCIKHNTRAIINQKDNGDLMLVMPVLTLLNYNEPEKHGISVYYTDEQKDTVMSVIKEFYLPVL